MKATDGKKGYQQALFQITITDEKNELVWDSKKVVSGFSHNIQYQGKALQPRTKYTWNVKVWDETGQSELPNLV